MTIHLRRHCLALGMTLLVLLGSAWPAQALTPQEVLDFCLNNPDKCALSVNHVTQGWERHLNGDRAQVTASTYKIIPLIAYAKAVVNKRIDPDRLITRDEWARFWVGLDGGSLSDAWNRLGQPTSITVDELVSAMMQESDNAAPDWLLNELGRGKLKRVVQRYVKGFHDVPASVNALFTTWFLNPAELGSGNRLPGDYSGFEVVGYQEEIEDTFGDLHDASFVGDAREVICVVPPWEPPLSGCSSTAETTTANFTQLTGRFFMRSTTRTYTRLMTHLLALDLLKPKVSDIVRRHLEFRLGIPRFDAFTRFAGKGGDLVPQDILNWTTYLESRATGDQVVVSIFMRNLPTATITVSDLHEFASMIVLDPAFAQDVAGVIPVDVPTPELILDTKRFSHRERRKGDQLLVNFIVRNAGTAKAVEPIPVALFISDDNQFDPFTDQRVATITLESIKPGKMSEGWLLAQKLPPIVGKYGIVVVDPDDIIAESVEDNNVTYQLIR